MQQRKIRVAVLSGLLATPVLLTATQQSMADRYPSAQERSQYHSYDKRDARREDWRGRGDGGGHDGRGDRYQPRFERRDADRGPPGRDKHFAQRPRNEPPRAAPPRRDWRDKDHYRRWDNHRPYRPAPPPRPWSYGPHYRDRWHPNYPRYRYHYRDNDFWGWLAFAVVTLAIIDNLNEHQQHEHQQAMGEALRAPVGETIHWNDKDAGGAVTITRDGTSSEGRYCREYRQKVRVGNEVQQAYGTACRNADGSWEIMD